MQPQTASVQTTRYGTVLVNVFQFDQGWVAQVADSNDASVPAPETGPAQSAQHAIEQLRQALEATD